MQFHSAVALSWWRVSYELMKTYLFEYKVYKNYSEVVMGDIFSVSVEELRCTLYDFQCNRWLSEAYDEWDKEYAYNNEDVWLVGR